METETLTGCPFCGHEPTIRPTAFRTFQGCCDCGGSAPPGRTRKEAAANWNRRASGWVPVSERLPEPDQGVIAWGPTGWLITSLPLPPSFAHLHHITHYHPLPAPPSPAGEPATKEGG